MEVVVQGSELPGRRWPTLAHVYENVHVALQVGSKPAGLVPGDAARAEWVTRVELLEREGHTDFRGPAVQGRPGERFLYLTWGEVNGDSFAMFRRAKLMLDDMPLGALAPKRAVAVVRLTDEQGAPRCARLRPPAITWTVQ